MIKEDGGPAFPSPFDPNYEGMTLRDYFAAAALKGYLSAPGDQMNIGRDNPGYAAKWAYDQADCMISERLSR